MEGEQFHISNPNPNPWDVLQSPSHIGTNSRLSWSLLQSQGVISPVTEPTEWCSPIVVAPKKNTDSIYPNVCWPVPTEQVCETWEIQVTNPLSSCRWHCSRKCKNLHQIGCHEGLSPVPIGRREPTTTNNIYHTFWSIQVATYEHPTVSLHDQLPSITTIECMKLSQDSRDFNV